MLNSIVFRLKRIKGALCAGAFLWRRYVNRHVIYGFRFAVGSTLFSTFYFFATGQVDCAVPTGPLTFAYLTLCVITLVLFFELGYLIVRIRSIDDQSVESGIMGKAALFLFDSLFLLLGCITAFAALYRVFPVINIACVSGQDALYFSMLTFTTLGYGDLIPNEQFRIIAASQAVLGYLTFGLVVGYSSTLFSIPSKR